MNLEKLYEMQKELDARIIKEKGLEGQDLLPNTVLALQVELGELANEWRGFKHWSNDQQPREMEIIINPYGDCGDEQVRYPLLEEYVDCLHFFLSIARQINMRADELRVSAPLKGTTVATFTELFYHIGAIGLRDHWTKRQAFNISFSLFLELGYQALGFTWEQIETAYLEKNAVNHERQANGY